MKREGRDFKTTIMKINHKKTKKVIPIAGVPSSQALPGYIIPAPPSVFVPDLIGVLAAWIQNKKRILRTTLLLRTTCMRSCCNWSFSCVALLGCNLFPKYKLQHVTVRDTSPGHACTTLLPLPATSAAAACFAKTTGGLRSLGFEDHPGERS